MRVRGRQSHRDAAGGKAALCWQADGKSITDYGLWLALELKGQLGFYE